MLDTEQIETFYSGCTPDGRLIPSREFARTIDRYYRQARAFDAAPEVEPVEEYEDFDRGAFDDLRKLARSGRAHDNRALSDLERAEIDAALTCGGWIGR